MRVSTEPIMSMSTEYPMRVSTELNRAEAVLFRQYLHANHINYEPSECYGLVHFECEMTQAQVDDANKFIDSCTSDCWHY